ncbi:MAG TPA: malonyl-ACP O-methyltransferase BioC [Dokdonella sp.]|uniref:malonyl-ACP O-methyltransferase BioC n=1 Tax=Dokdonella sp. TaxID=2291710 RepID=UPI002D806FC2|nr:malonyl-ACP O-methyltransferase BioC [Dokdonella sp.]HET9032699.1 malonyl-ACP O-methyltransferase BioC [Dokdonella sp.]
MSGIFDSAQVRRSFGRAAASYDAHAILQEEVQARLQERLDDSKLAPSRIVDVGSGTGRGTAALRKRFPQAQTIALDLALPMLQAAKKNRGWLRPFARVCGDTEALPFVDASVDLLHSNLCLQWSGNLEAAFASFRRVMRANGLLLFSTFAPQTLNELRAAFAEVGGGAHVSGFLDIQQIGDAVLAAGFRDPVLERDVFTLTYPDVRSLMRELRAIGATNANRDRSRTLTGKAHLQRVIEAYETFRHEGLLPATFEVVYAQAWAPAAGQPIRSGSQDIASFPIDSLRGSRRRRN